MNNIKINLTYDGTDYYGWQKTKHGPSIEEELENALKKIFQKSLKLQAASRTDKNVHAKNQVVNFFLEKEVDLGILKHKLNCMLPKDIRILKIEKAEPNFHPSTDCKKKQYCYYIRQSSFNFPHLRFYSWNIHQNLDIEKMKAAAEFLIGTKDYSSFTNRKQTDSIRTIFDISIEKKDEHIIISITGDNFLYKMARIMVGTLVYAGLNKIDAGSIKKILLSKDRKLSGMTAPAHGLFLNEIFY
ncbi:MAG: tRNA pseudouridine(38-40) synthase TruA [Parachlamydiales bacterium]|jgi:tRNA pseudouridine38-40 synthase